MNGSTHTSGIYIQRVDLYGGKIIAGYDSDYHKITTMVRLGLAKLCT